MIAARLHAARDLRVEAVPPPEAGPGELLVRVEAAGVCGSVLHVWRTGAFVTRFPVTPGHEVTGVVAAAGDGARTAPGTRVVMDSKVPCGTCPECRAGHPQRCGAIGFLGEVCDGGFAELLAVPEAAVCPVPAGLDARVAVLAEPAAVAMHARRRLERFAPEARRVGVLGGGPIGALCALMLPSTTDVVVAETDPARARLLAAAGLQVTDALPPGFRADAVFDCAGFAGSVASAMAACAPGGIVMLVSLHHGPETLDANVLLAGEHAIAGCHVFEDELPDTLAALAADPARFAAVVTRQVGLAELPGVVAEAAAGGHGGLKTIVVPEGAT
ncbi:MAG: alcohol dehydrogenase catalytic domain-containing protein [Thermoleophilia bacterium]|nr:alcohol dehydrogenase catalytic domain-containing protein [Thermoleophilia bacterium]